MIYTNLVIIASLVEFKDLSAAPTWIPAERHLVRRFGTRVTLQYAVHHKYIILNTSVFCKDVQCLYSPNSIQWTAFKRSKVKFLYTVQITKECTPCSHTHSRTNMGKSL